MSQQPSPSRSRGSSSGSMSSSRSGTTSSSDMEVASTSDAESTLTSRSGATLTSRRAARNPDLDLKLQNMRLPLAPLVQLTSGEVHPAFPPTLLGFWLLTDAQLESLASFYHQRSPCALTAQYPCPVTWRSNLPLEEKRRKIGRFIGLRGCESPVVGAEPVLALWYKTEEEFVEAARRARERDEEAQRVREKMGWY